LPEVIAFPLTAGLAPYLQWVERETTGATDWSTHETRN
jgi:hypothetical protein